MSIAWSLLTVLDSDRSYMGNGRYEDELGKRYTWDETVPNSSRLRRGDLIVLRDNENVLGLGWIDRIDTWSGSKERYRCPRCGSTKFKNRKTMSPRYRCGNCKEKFEVPSVEHLRDITFYRADYEKSWLRISSSLHKSDIEPAALSGARQNAIRELDLRAVKGIVGGVQRIDVAWWSLGS